MNTEELIASIDARLTELNEQIELLEQARSALGENGAAPAPAPVPKRPRRGRRSSRQSAAGPADLHRLLADNDGLTSPALAELAGADPRQVLPLLREMEVAGRVRRSGQRWHAVQSEEEWIEQRAAELAARSTA